MHKVSKKPNSMFASGAIFNLLAGIPILLAPATIAELAGITSSPSAHMLMRMTALAIIGFGWAYWLIAKEPRRLRPIILLGVALKIGFVTLAFGYWLNGAINFLLPAVAMGDVLYSILFLAYYRRTSTLQTSGPAESAGH